MHRGDPCYRSWTVIILWQRESNSLIGWVTAPISIPFIYLFESLKSQPSSAMELLEAVKNVWRTETSEDLLQVSYLKA